MGPYGLSSRILSNKLNSQIVYTFTPEYIKKNKLEQALIDPETLEELYGFSKIDEETSLYGVIGKDVNTSLSPQIHNKGFKRKILIPFISQYRRCHQRKPWTLPIFLR